MATYIEDEKLEQIMYDIRHQQLPFSLIRNMITEYATKAYLKGREDERKAFIRALKKDDQNH